jgi:acetamidase/formamidase
MLRVDVLALRPGDWGWAAILPGLGLLPDDFPEPWVATFDLRASGSVEVAPGIRIPIAPFLGTMGTTRTSPRRRSPSRRTRAAATSTRAT